MNLSEDLKHDYESSVNLSEDWKHDYESSVNLSEDWKHDYESSANLSEDSGNKYVSGQLIIAYPKGRAEIPEGNYESSVRCHGRYLDTRSKSTTVYVLDSSSEAEEEVSKNDHHI